MHCCGLASSLSPSGEVQTATWHWFEALASPCGALPACWHDDNDQHDDDNDQHDDDDGQHDDDGNGESMRKGHVCWCKVTRSYLN